MFLLLLVACSNPTTNDNKRTGLTEQKLDTEFKDDGIRIFYTFTGKLEKIEIFGQADAWKGEFETLAEADALAKLVKFLYGTEVNTQRRIKIIGLALEKAGDNAELNNENTSFSTRDTDLENELINKEKNNSVKEEVTNSIKVTASRINKNLMETSTTITSKGRLTGVRKVRDSQSNNGKTYIAVYQWSEKDQSIAESIRNRMVN